MIPVRTKGNHGTGSRIYRWNQRGDRGTTVFELVNKGSGLITTLASFNGTNGANPVAGIVFDTSGNLYGTTQIGGASNDGTVFEIARGSGAVTNLFSFDSTSGANPSGIVLDASGNLYGTTQYGGPTTPGTVFELSPFAAPPTVVGAVALSDSSSATANQAQRSEVRNLTVTFSEPVTLGSNPFTLQLMNSGGSGLTDATAALGTPVQVAGTNGTQWSVPVLANTAFSDSTGSLKDGLYQLVVHGAAVASNGTPMVLDFTSPTFHRLLGDLNGDGMVGFNDLLVLAQNYGSTTATAAQGDMNGDGRVGFADLLILAQSYGRTISPATAATPFDASADPLRPRPARRGRLIPRGPLNAALSEPTR